MIIKNAILHIFDLNSGITVYSDETMLIDKQIESFLSKHINKIYNVYNSQEGIFKADSSLQIQLDSYLNNKIDFIAFSQNLGKEFNDFITKSDKLISYDLIICEVNIDDIPVMIILKCDNRAGYIHKVVQNDNGTKNEIISHYAIMPNINQKITEFACINLTTKKIQFNDKKYSVDGNDCFLMADYILQCDYNLPAKTSIKLVNDIAKKVAEENGQDPTKAIVKAKNCIIDTIKTADCIDTKKISADIFPESAAMQQEYEAQIQQTNIPEKVYLDKDHILKTEKMHKIKTDTGIEINIPIEYFNNNDYVQILNNDDGTLSINLKNINNITDK